MKKKNFKYNAFISYRHCDLDKFVAENLHRLIETYKMPEPVVEKYNITDNNIRRIFRDQEELPLSSSLEAPIIEALKESEYLIVICSPRIKESLWCKKEIESFIKLRGRNNILCVLVEGEPQDSFPEEVLYYEEEVKTKTGKTKKKKVYCEPLAMDVRGANKKEIYKNLKKEIIRIIAPLYKLDYDDIKRRHEERELKRKANIFRIVAIASIAFAIYSFALFSRIYLSSKQLKYDQSINLAKEANELFAKDNRVGAVEKAYQSVTKYNNMKMPVTAKGLYELTDAMELYYYNKSGYNVVSQLDTKGMVNSIKTNSDGTYLLSYDGSDELILWDLKKEKKIKTITDVSITSRNGKGYSFIGKDKYAYINENEEIVISDLKGNKIKTIKTKLYSSSIKGSRNGKYLKVNNYHKVEIYESEKYTMVGEYEAPEGWNISDSQYFDLKDENLIITLSKKSTSSDNSGLKILTYNIKDKKAINTYSLDADTMKKMIFKNDNLIILSEIDREVARSKGSDMQVTNLDYKTGKLYYQKTIIGNYAYNISMAFSEDGSGTILVAGSKGEYLLDFKTGDRKAEFEYGALLIRPVSDFYFIITNKGYAVTIDNDNNMYSDNIPFVGLYNFNLGSYSEFIYTAVGYLGYSQYDNKIIIYNHIINKDFKETEYKVELLKYEKKDYNDISTSSKIEEEIKDYDIMNKDLISCIFYSKDKKLLFISYSKNKEFEIYNTKTKKLLKRIKLETDLPTSDMAKTKDGKILIKGVEAGYILNKELDVIARIPGLQDYKNNKLIINAWFKNYEVKMYSEKEVISKAKKFLESKGKI